MISIVATETSTATFLSVPGVAYTGDFSYLQLALGYILRRVVVATVLRSIDGFGVAVASVVLLGLAITIGNVLVPTVIRRDVPARGRAAATSVYSVAINVGTVITSLATVPLAAVVGWHRRHVPGGQRLGRARRAPPVVPFCHIGPLPRHAISRPCCVPGPVWGTVVASRWDHRAADDDQPRGPRTRSDDIHLVLVRPAQLGRARLHRHRRGARR